VCRSAFLKNPQVVSIAQGFFLPSRSCLFVAVFSCYYCSEFVVIFVTMGGVIPPPSPSLFSCPELRLEKFISRGNTRVVATKKRII